MSGRLITIRAIIFLYSLTALNRRELIVEWEVRSFRSISLILVFIIDFISIYFIILVRLVSGSVIIFSQSYMRPEKFFGRFLMLVVSFIRSIFLLILSPNIISLLLGWDGLGVTSYLLVIFYQRSKSFNAGILTALTNRLGDVGLLSRLALISYYGDWTFVFYNRSSVSYSRIVVLIVILSACTKRAQIPFSAWLPAAIAAPTPVSALVHSSTLVTAGVYLLIRINILIIFCHITYILLWIGVFTIIMAGLAAMFETDIKKVIALSTLRQLGVIIIVIGINMPLLSFFHLISHAFFKAMLFMCAGIIIHNIGEYQDIRKMGIGATNLRLAGSVIIIANLSLSGFPFLRGFYSKDLILEIIIIGGQGPLIIFILSVGTFLTVFYSCRIRFFILFNLIKSESIFLSQDGDKRMLKGIIFLCPFSIIGGILISWNIISRRSHIFIPSWIKILILIIIRLAIAVYYISFCKNNPSSKNSIYRWFMGNIWFMPLVFRLAVSQTNLRRSSIFSKFVEFSWREVMFYKHVINLFSEQGAIKSFELLTNSYILKTVEVILVFLLIFIIWI